MRLSHYAVVISLSALAFYAAITLRNEMINQAKAENIRDLEAKVANVVPAIQMQEKPYEEGALGNYTQK